MNVFSTNDKKNLQSSPNMPLYHLTCPSLDICLSVSVCLFVCLHMACSICSSSVKSVERPRSRLLDAVKNHHPIYHDTSLSKHFPTTLFSCVPLFLFIHTSSHLFLSFFVYSLILLWIDPLANCERLCRQGNRKEAFSPTTVCMCYQKKMLMTTSKSQPDVETVIV